MLINYGKGGGRVSLVVPGVMEGERGLLGDEVWVMGAKGTRRIDKGVGEERGLKSEDEYRTGNEKQKRRKAVKRDEGEKKGKKKERDVYRRKRQAQDRKKMFHTETEKGHRRRGNEKYGGG